MAKGIAHRKWALYRSDYETDADFRAAIENEAALNVHIQERLGIAIVSGPGRQRVGNDWFTQAMFYETATIPAAREQEPDEPLEAEPALVEDPDEPVLAE